MPTPPKRLSSDSAYARDWNKMRDYVRSLKPSNAIGTRTDHTQAGTFRRAARMLAVPPGSSDKTYVVHQHKGDYLVCYTYDEDTLVTGTTPVYVAKPWELRYSVLTETVFSVVHTYSDYDEDAQTRTATDGDVTEDQIITPPYLNEGDNPTIIRARTVKGGTGAAVLVDEDDPSQDIPITLEDCNRGGRAWAWMQPE